MLALCIHCASVRVYVYSDSYESEEARLAHYDLSGAGVQALTPASARLYVEITTLSAITGSGRATPVNRFDVGLLRMGVGDWYFPTIPVDADHMVVDVPSGVTNLGYAMLNGCAIGVDEDTPPAGGGGGLPVTDLFSAAAAPLPSPPWTNTEAHPVSTDGTGGADVGGVSDNIAIWNADTFPDDQTVTVEWGTTSTGGGNQYIGVVARSNGLAESACSCYQFFSDGGSDTELVKIVGGTFTVLGTDNAMTATPGDLLTLTCIGTSIVASKNGTPVISVTDAAVASGQPGIVLNSSFGIGFAIAASWTADAA